jgi:hypothetical protein
MEGGKAGFAVVLFSKIDWNLSQGHGKHCGLADWIGQSWENTIYGGALRIQIRLLVFTTQRLHVCNTYHRFPRRCLIINKSGFDTIVIKPSRINKQHNDGNM